MSLCLIVVDSLQTGYALLAMAEAIEDLCHEFHQGNFVSRFDLVAGTSVSNDNAVHIAHIMLIKHSWKVLWTKLFQLMSIDI